MKIRIALTTLLAAVFFAALPATYASVRSVQPPVHALFFSGQKNIKINLRNDTHAPLELKIGDTVTTLQPGTVLGEKLPVGTRIITNTATTDLKVGDLVIQVYAGMYSDSTLSIK
jgi:hypothetical protein